MHHSNPAVNEALTAARLTADLGEQKTRCLAMQHALYDDPAGFFAYSVDFARA